MVVFVVLFARGKTTRRHHDVKFPGQTSILLSKDFIRGDVNGDRYCYVSEWWEPILKIGAKGGADGSHVSSYRSGRRQGGGTRR